MASPQATRALDAAAFAALCGNPLNSANYFTGEETDLDNIQNGTFFDDGVIDSRLAAPSITNFADGVDTTLGGVVDVEYLVHQVSLPTVAYPTVVMISLEAKFSIPTTFPALQNVRVSVRQGTTNTDPKLGTNLNAVKEAAGARFDHDLEMVRYGYWAANAARDISVWGALSSATGTSPDVHITDMWALEFHQ